MTAPPPRAAAAEPAGGRRRERNGAVGPDGGAGRHHVAPSRRARPTRGRLGPGGVNVASAGVRGARAASRSPAPQGVPIANAQTGETLEGEALGDRGLPDRRGVQQGVQEARSSSRRRGQGGDRAAGGVLFKRPSTVAGRGAPAERGGRARRRWRSKPRPRPSRRGAPSRRRGGARGGRREAPRASSSGSRVVGVQVLRQGGQVVVGAAVYAKRRRRRRRGRRRGAGEGAAKEEVMAERAARARKAWVFAESKASKLRRSRRTRRRASTSGGGCATAEHWGTDARGAPGRATSCSTRSSRLRAGGRRAQARGERERRPSSRRSDLEAIEASAAARLGQDHRDGRRRPDAPTAKTWPTQRPRRGESSYEPRGADARARAVRLPGQAQGGRLLPPPRRLPPWRVAVEAQKAEEIGLASARRAASLAQQRTSR